VKIYIQIDVPDDWEKRLDMQQTVEREIKADRWAWFSEGKICAAHIAELLAGVEMPEPTDFCDVPFQHIWGYTADQLRTAVAAAVAVAKKDVQVNAGNRCIEILEADVDALTAERDALRKPLQEMVDMMDSGEEHGHGSEWYVSAKAALEQTK
jgi:hypothetical protein